MHLTVKIFQGHVTMATPLFKKKFYGTMSELNLETRSSNLKSVALMKFCVHNGVSLDTCVKFEDHSFNRFEAICI